MDNFMDGRVHIRSIVTGLAWTAGSALVVLEVLFGWNIGRLGILVTIFGTVVWTRGWFKTLKQRELVAFDHGRQFERGERPGVVPMHRQRK